MAKMTKAAAVREFKIYHLQFLPKRDCSTRRNAWNTYIDYLVMDRRITKKQFYTWTQPKDICAWDDTRRRW